jgi:hypothetical protein
LQKTIQCLPIKIVALHENSPDLLSVLDIFQRIGVEQNQISDLAILDRRSVGQAGRLMLVRSRCTEGNKQGNGAATTA